QGLALNADQPLRNLLRPGDVSAEAEADSQRFLRRLNETHALRNPGDSRLQGRTAAFALAGLMQLSAPEAADLSRETAEVRKLYGVDDPNRLKAAYARNCLLARRLLERDVRYVTLYCSSRASGVDGLLNWDAHK